MEIHSKEKLNSCSKLNLTKKCLLSALNICMSQNVYTFSGITLCLFRNIQLSLTSVPDRMNRYLITIMSWPNSLVTFLSTNGKVD